jgi:hypothetical protein
MTPDLVGRLETRLLVALFAVLPVVAAVAALFGLGGRADSAVVFTLYWLVFGLAVEPLYALLQRLRREGDWPLAHVAYGMGLEALVVHALMRADVLPGLPACLAAAVDPALRRSVCATPSLGSGETVALWLVGVATTFVVLCLVLPVLAPRWRPARGRLLLRGRR